MAGEGNLAEHRAFSKSFAPDAVHSKRERHTGQRAATVESIFAHRAHSAGEVGGLQGRTFVESPVTDRFYIALELDRTQGGAILKLILPDGNRIAREHHRLQRPALLEHILAQRAGRDRSLGNGAVVESIGANRLNRGGQRQLARQRALREAFISDGFQPIRPHDFGQREALIESLVAYSRQFLGQDKPLQSLVPLHGPIRYCVSFQQDSPQIERLQSRHPLSDEVEVRSVQVARQRQALRPGVCHQAAQRPGHLHINHEGRTLLVLHPCHRCRGGKNISHTRMSRSRHGQQDTRPLRNLFHKQ